MDTWFGIGAILVGLTGCFYGYPLFRLRTFLILAGLIYGYLFGHSFVPESHPWLSLEVGLGAVVILGILAYPIYSVGIIVIGGALGFMILSSIGVVLNAPQGTVILLGVLGAAALCFLFYHSMDPLVMLSTALNSAVQVVYGLGLLFPALALGGGRANSLAVVAILVLGGFGFVFQYVRFKDLHTYSRKLL